MLDNDSDASKSIKNDLLKEVVTLMESEATLVTGPKLSTSIGKKRVYVEALCFSFRNMFIKKISKHSDGTVLMATQVFIISIFLFPIGLKTWSPG